MESDEYYLESEIGSGVFAKVYRCYVNNESKKTYAVKIYNNQNNFEDSFERNKEFIDLSQKVDGVCKIHKILKNEKFYYIENCERKVIISNGILMDYVEGYTMESLYKQTKLNVDEVVSIMSKLFEILAEIHYHNIIHRDIKPDNIMITEKNKIFSVTLIDFGLSTNKIKERGQVGTVLYRAPEIFKGESYTTKCDIYAMGIILYSLIECRDLYIFVDDKKIRYRTHIAILSRGFEKILKGRCKSPIWNEKPALFQVLEKCIRIDPKERCSAGEACELFANAE